MAKKAKKKVSGKNTLKILKKELLKANRGFDRSLQLPPTGHVSMYGLETIWDANHFTGSPGMLYEVEVDLGIKFNSQPTVQLSRKLIHDANGNIYDSGDHDISYRWVDCSTYRRFKIVVHSKRLNYPPQVSYLVTGNIGAVN